LDLRIGKQKFIENKNNGVIAIRWEKYEYIRVTILLNNQLKDERERKRNFIGK
jgi:hypothetical protein